MAEYTTRIRVKGEMTIPKEIREKYDLNPGVEVELIPKIDGVLVRPRVRDPVKALEGLLKDVWPREVSSVALVKELREKVDFEVKEKFK